MPIDVSWLSLTHEEPLDPGRELIDPHHHLWEFPGASYLAGDFAADCAALQVKSSVFVECGTCYDPAADGLAAVGETRFAETQAQCQNANHPTLRAIAAGIVGFADLQVGELTAAVLDAHLAASPMRFRGIRHSCTWHASDHIRNSHSDPPPRLYLREDFRAGFAQLAPRGLLFDAWCYHTQLPELTSLASTFANTTIVLDHVGGPLGIGPYANKRAEVFEQWRKDMANLARCPNVYVKLGGLGMAINGFGWHRQHRPPNSTELADAWGPYFLHCIDTFGVERCLFESNFPVDKVSCSYTVLWNCFKKIAARYNQADQDLLLAGNAARIYALP